MNQVTEREVWLNIYSIVIAEAIKASNSENRVEEIWCIASKYAKCAAKEYVAQFGRD